MPSTFAVAGAPTDRSSSAEWSYPIELLGASIEIASPLHGVHQQRNIALAIAAAVELRTHHGLPITPQAIAAGIRNTRWPGRLETIETLSATCTPMQWILDVAHNPAGAWALRAFVNRYQQEESGRTESRSPREQVFVRGLQCLIFSCLRDKPVTELAQILFPLFDRVIFAPIHSPRATPMPDLLAAAATTGTPATVAASIDEAITLAEQFALASPTGERIKSSTPRVVISGSVYLVGEARPLLLARAAKSETSA